MRKMRPWEIKKLPQSQTTIKWQSQDSAFLFESGDLSSSSLGLLWAFLDSVWIRVWIWPLRNGTISWRLWGRSSRGKGKTGTTCMATPSHLATPPFGTLCSLKMDLSFLTWKMDIGTPLGVVVRLEGKMWEVLTAQSSSLMISRLVPGMYKTLRNGGYDNRGHVPKPLCVSVSSQVKRG